MSPSALNVSVDFEANSMIGSLRARVSAKADLTSPMCAWIALYNSASPLTTRVAEDSQLAFAVAEPSHEAWHSAAPLQFSVPSQDGGATSALHFPWPSPLQSA